jgi:hypothetical protein
VAQIGVVEVAVQDPHRLVADVRAEIGMGEVGSFGIAVEASDDLGTGKVGADKDRRVLRHVFHARCGDRAVEQHAREIGPREVRSHEPGEIEPVPGKIGAGEIGVVQLDVVEVRVREIGTGEVEAREVRAGERAPGEIDGMAGPGGTNGGFDVGARKRAGERGACGEGERGDVKKQTGSWHA